MGLSFERAGKAANGLDFSVSRLVSSFVAGGAIEKVIEHVVARSKVWQSISHALSKENLSRNGLMERELSLVKKIENLQRDSLTTSGFDKKFIDHKLLSSTQEFNLLVKQKTLQEAMEKAGQVRIALAGAYGALALSTYQRQSSFNRELIKANSSSEKRNSLLSDSLSLQSSTGAGFADIAEAAAALANYGLDTKQTFGENLKIVVQMKGALGVSVTESAQLATIVENRLHASFSAVSDVIADIVDNTALAGSEATQLAHTITMAMSRLRPGLSAVGLPEVVRLAGRYEGALKEVGGSAGDLGQLINQLTSAGGLVSQGMLGVSPDMLASKEGFQTAMDRFAKLGNSMVSSQNSQQRLQQLQIFAEQFGLSVDQANSLLKMTKQLNREQTTQVSLQERWNNQMRDTNAGLSRIGSSLVSLLQNGMLPFVESIGSLANSLANGIDAITKYKSVVPLISGGLVLGAFGLVWSLKSVAGAMYEVGTASLFAARQLNAQAIAQGIGGAGGKAGRGFIARILTKGVIADLIATALLIAEASGLAGIIAVAMTSAIAAGAIFGLAALPFAITAYAVGLAKNSAATLENTNLMAKIQSEHNQTKLRTAEYARTQEDVFSAIRFGNANPATLIDKMTADYKYRRSHTGDRHQQVLMDREYQEQLSKLNATAKWAFDAKHVFTTRTASSDAADAETQEEIAESTKKGAALAAENAKLDAAAHEEQRVQWAKENAAEAAQRSREGQRFLF